MFEFLNFILSKVVFFTGMILGKTSFPKPLSQKEEKEYLIAFKERGDLKAKETLINHNLRLVAHIAKKYQTVGEVDDLISVGSIGLVKAINTYELGKGTTLATYTAKCIENEILMLIRANKKHVNTLSLNEPVGLDKEGNELNIMDIVTEGEDVVFRDVENKINREKLIKHLKNCLTDREYKIICLRYGLNGRPMPQREVAGFLKISRSYVSRIEKKALEKMKEELTK